MMKEIQFIFNPQMDNNVEIFFLNLNIINLLPKDCSITNQAFVQA